MTTSVTISVKEFNSGNVNHPLAVFTDCFRAIKLSPAASTLRHVLDVVIE